MVQFRFPLCTWFCIYITAYWFIAFAIYRIWLMMLFGYFIWPCREIRVSDNLSRQWRTYIIRKFVTKWCHWCFCAYVLAFIIPKSRKFIESLLYDFRLKESIALAFESLGNFMNMISAAGFLLLDSAAQ